MLQEAQAAQAKFVSLRREHSTYKAETDAKILHLEAQLANSDAGNDAKVDSWRGRALTAEEAAGACQWHLFSGPALFPNANREYAGNEVWPAEKLQQEFTTAKQAIRDRDHHLTQIRHLTAEVGDVTAAKAAAESKLVHVESAGEERVRQARAAQLEAQHERDGATRRSQALEAELLQLEASNKRLAELASRSQEERAVLATQITSERATHEDEVRALEDAVARAERAAESKLEDEQRTAATCKQEYEEQIHRATNEMELIRSEVCDQLVRSLLHSLNSDRTEQQRLLCSPWLRMPC